MGAARCPGLSDCVGAGVPDSQQAHRRGGRVPAAGAGVPGRTAVSGPWGPALPQLLQVTVWMQRSHWIQTLMETRNLIITN